MNADARLVLARYGLGDAPATPMQTGFGGASLWRVQHLGRAYALKAWPADFPLHRLAFGHILLGLADSAGLRVVPSLIRAETGGSAVEHAGRFWELTTWLPGQSDFSEAPTPARLRSAVEALAQLHAAAAESPECCRRIAPAVLRRLDAAEGWLRLTRDGWRPDFADADDPVTPWAVRAWAALTGRVELVRGRLARWSVRTMPLRPCHGDPWHDNLLFAGDTLSGIVDFGAAGLDTPLSDLARLLGSLAGGATDALSAYGVPLPADAVECITALDSTGVVLSAAGWLRRLYGEHRPYPDRSAVARRLAELVARLEV